MSPSTVGLPARLAGSVLLLSLGACHDASGPPPDRTFGAVSAGMYHSCALTRSGRAYCWGRNLYGALGDGTTIGSDTPVAVVGTVRFTAVSAGWDHSCALDGRGAVYCWGMNFAGQLGDGSTQHRAVPVLVGGGVAFQSITTGEAYTCGVARTGPTYCWGADLSPAPDGTPPGVHPLPVPLSGPRFATISAGYEIACALTATGTPYCWGLVPPGVVFPDSFLASQTPLPVADPAVLTAVSAGFKHACGLDAAGHAACWGQNFAGQLGDGTRTGSDTLRPVSGGRTWRLIRAHAPMHTCGIDAAGAALCWGGNASGELGDGSMTASTVPVPVAGGRGIAFLDLTVGSEHTCGLTAGGEVYCWGKGGDGQLGTGRRGNEPLPAVVSLP